MVQNKLHYATHGHTASEIIYERADANAPFMNIYASFLILLSSWKMCYELIDRIIIGGSQSVTGKEREIEIVYKIDISSVMRHRLKK